MIDPLVPAHAACCENWLGPCEAAVIRSRWTWFNIINYLAKKNSIFLNKAVQSVFSDVLRRWTDSATTVLPILTELLKNDVRVWVYRYVRQHSISFSSTDAATGNRNVVVVALSTMSLWFLQWRHRWESAGHFQQILREPAPAPSCCKMEGMVQQHSGALLNTSLPCSLHWNINANIF